MLQGVDDLVDAVELLEDRSLEHHPDPDPAVGGGRLGRVLARGYGDERCGHEHPELGRRGLLHLRIAVPDRVDAGHDLDEGVDAEPGHGGPVLLGEAHQGLLGQAQPVATLGDQGPEGHRRRRGDVGQVRRADRQARADERAQVLFDLRLRDVEHLGQVCRVLLGRPTRAR